MNNLSSPMLNPQIVAHENHRSPPQANGDLHAQLSSPSYASLCSSTPDDIRHKLLSRHRQMKQMLHYTSSSTTCRKMESGVSHANNEGDAMESDSRNNGYEIVEEPKAGMCFDSEEEVRSYYMKYAKQVGFGMVKRSSRTGNDGKLKYFTLVCVREGISRSTSSNIIKPRPMEKFGCKARINAALCADGRFTLSCVVLEHTHSLSPGKARFFRCHKKLDSHTKRKLEVNDMAGIRVCKNFKSLVVDAGGDENLSFGERDCRNYLREARLLRLGEGDAEALHNYFRKMQKKNEGFYYVMDVDNENRLRNVFWADARSRAAYECFGDVITFDTTYLTNAYKMPFAPFVGVNHHGQSILLECGLISSEDTETFEWLFEAWLDCMSGRSPNAIITDQDKAMQNAIARVFPTSKHIFCLWHIMKKLPEKFGACFDYEAIKSCLQKCVYDSLTCDEFEEQWQTLLTAYDLYDNAWLTWLYSERHLWVPAYVKTTFWAGMSTTQRSESMNAFFDGYVNSKTTLKQFVEQYDNALRRNVENEAAADFSSFNTQFPCISHYSIERQLQEMYTNTKFKEVQDEFRGFLYCCADLMSLEDGLYTYQVADEVKIRDGFIKRANFCVTFNEDEFELKCTYLLFEFKGIVCRHALRVLTYLNKDKLPLKYILDRWRKDLRRRYTLVKSNYDEHCENPEAQRYHKLVHKFYEIVSAASCSEKGYNKLMCHLEHIKGEYIQMATICDDITTSNYPPSASTGGNSDKVLSPIKVKSKGRPPSKRKQSTLEKSRKRLKTRKSKQNKKSAQSCEHGTLTHLSLDDFSAPSTALSRMTTSIQLSEHETRTHLLPDFSTPLTAQSTMTIQPHIVLLVNESTPYFPISQDVDIDTIWDFNDIVILTTD